MTVRSASWVWMADSIIGDDVLLDFVVMRLGLLACQVGVERGQPGYLVRSDPDACMVTEEGVVADVPEFAGVIFRMDCLRLAVRPVP